jgi:very-short-patch-repair endonuclease
MADHSKGSKSEPRKLSKNVFDFLHKASVAYGKQYEMGFSIRMYQDLDRSEYDSPIEDLFQIALELQIELFGPTSKEGSFSYEKQAVIGKYRVDFLLTYQSGISVHRIIVELDGHNFHEKNKHQRSYEKARDRFLIKSGYQVIHFTGSDVCADPHQVVFESLSMLGLPEYNVDHVDDLDPNDLLNRCEE